LLKSNKTNIIKSVAELIVTTQQDEPTSNMARVFDEMVSRKAFRYFAKQVGSFRLFRFFSLFSLFREMARFGEKCFAKQRNNILISRNSKKITCYIEGPEGHRGDREP
jgi:hypothetical protein